MKHLHYNKIKFSLENVKISLINVDQLLYHYAHVYSCLKGFLKLNSFLGSVGKQMKRKIKSNLR